MSNRLLLIIIGLLVANLVVGIVKSPTDTAGIADDGSVGLLRPWFIDEALASDDRSARAVNNIANEAGISAYVKTPAAIDLNVARTALTSTIEVNANYVLGTITPAGYDGDFGAQVMIHKVGWIMAWYHKDQVASMIVHVKDTNLSNQTKLSLAINAVTTKLRITAIWPNYYHFKYPTANRMVIARKKASSGDNVKISIPMAVIISESSAYIQPDYSGARFYVNGVQISCCDDYTNELQHYFDITNRLDAAVNNLEFDEYRSDDMAVVIIYKA